MAYLPVSDTPREAKWVLRVFFVLLLASTTCAIKYESWIAWLISAVLISGMWIAARDWVHYRANPVDP